MDKPRYDHRKIEKKWQKYWLENQTFKAQIDPKKPKYYVLDMFPYPSGAGLHVGHVTGYTGTDILARFKRQQGFNVLHPMGWDSFGLPAEQYAVRTGVHPEKTTQKNIDTYRRQLMSLGFSYDWQREIATSDPSYYKWTQWIFARLFEKGLAYEAEMNVNYCPALGTVLANEEVENGKARDWGYPVVRKPLKQWILKITLYADRLIEDLNEVDWPENIKKLQINWIGKSEGARVFFGLDGSDDAIEVFTTRPDTLFGATYLVLSPEHPLLEKITAPGQKPKVLEYQKLASSKSDLERTDLAKEKTGVFTGAFAFNPVNGQKIPVWTSDYVLSGYGTGAIMAVPAHDERDFEFAQKYELPVICVFEPDPEQIELKAGETLQQVQEKILSGQRCYAGGGRAIHSKNASLNLNGLSVEKAKTEMIRWLQEQKKGEGASSYKLRDWLFSRQRYWGEPIPILHFADGTKRALSIDELPLLPPELSDYKPAGGGESPLAKVKEWVEVQDPKTGKKAKRETNTMPQWAGSCWYYLRFIDPKNDQAAWSPEADLYWMPVDQYVGGTEHAVLHLLYARFWHKVLFDLGFVHTKEPFKTYRYPGLVGAPSYKLPEGGYLPPDEVFEKDGRYLSKKDQTEVIVQTEKMSKSKLNGVNPDEIVEEFGADSLRLYEMFMGPFDKEKVWNTDAVSGCSRFLNRFFDLCHSEKVSGHSEQEPLEALKLGHKLTDQVTSDIENLQFNTAIAHLMEFINAFSKLSSYPKKVLEMALQMLHPFAPHIAEELWEHLGHKSSIAYAPLAQVEPKYLVEALTTYVIQINGKLRGKLDLPKEKSEEEILKLAKSHPNIEKYLANRKIKKTVFVPDKLINLVIDGI
ncbi:MAG: leucine--tRNA ligase [Parachlamydiales bacterium]|jgi:leucyl-tRNA synthetase